MPADPAAVKSLFLELAAVDEPTDRADRLRERCGADSELLARVSALLAANDRAVMGEGTATFPAGTAGAGTADYPGRDEQIGAILAGKYKLMEEIGEGGMGSVYMALQTEPVKRAVAVKVIKAGMDSKAVLARFEAERQALAMMDHPNIARVLDAGTTESGRPYFVMELVKGVPITEFCDERKLTPRQRLELFVPVCNAIQHAHQKGVIHRDIKPSNVLVALYDDCPVPKVIDFGVAKAAGQSLTDKTLMTGFGAVVGTPEYMSPEQANLNNLDIDTRSDVYSLGVLLYELLTGTTPVDRKSLGKAALLELLRIVREVEVPKPSAKLSSTDTLPSVAAARGTEPAQLSKLMKGELDWVVLKALEKDRARRYDTANALARDVQRYLADELVEARPPSPGYRLRKFVRRHKGRVLTAGLVLFALVAGIAGTTVGFIRAKTAEGVAYERYEEAEGERQKAEESARAKATALRASEDARERARQEVVRLHVGNGNGYLKAGTDRGPALLWFNRAWQSDAAAGAYEVNHRLRVGLTLRDSPDLIGLAVHDAPLTDAAVDEKGLVVLTLTKTGTAYLCDLATGRKTVLPHPAAVTAVAFRSAGRWAVTGSEDGTARVWDAATGKQLHVLGHGESVACVALAPTGNLVATVGGKTGVKLWGAANGEPAGHSPAAPGAYYATFDSTGGKLLTATGEGVARVWDTATGDPLSPELPHSARTVYEKSFGLRRGPAFTPDDARVLTSVHIENAHRSAYQQSLWSLTEGRSLWGPVSVPGAYAYAFSPDRKLVLCAGAPPGLYDLATGNRLVSVTTPRECQAGCFLAANVLATATTGGLIQQWVLETEPATKAVTVRPAFVGGHGAGTVQRLTPVPGRGFFTAGRDGTARLYEALHLRPTKPYAFDCGRAHLLPPARDGAIRRVFSPDGAAECRYGPDGPPRLGPRGGGEWPVALAAAGPVTSARFCGNGRRLCTTNEKEITCWDTGSGSPVGRPIPHPANETAVTLSDDGSLIGVADTAGNATTVYVVATGRALFRTEFGPSPDGLSSNTHLAISPDNRLVAVNSRHFAGAIEMWDTTTATRLYEFSPHRGVLWGMTFSEDSSTLIVNSTDTTARLYDARTGRPVGPPLRNTGFCRQVAVAPDGRRAATADGNVLRFWDATTGEDIHSWSFGSNTKVSINNLWFSRDGRRLIAVTTNGVRTIDLGSFLLAAQRLPPVIELLTGRRIDPATDGVEYLPEDTFTKNPAGYLAAWRTWRGRPDE